MKLWTRFPAARYVEYPPDVAAKDELRSLLCQTDLFGAATDEAKAYLDSALERFRITMALLPPLGPESRILELGANPYFVTRLLRRRGLEVCAANWFGERSGFGSEGVQRVVESGIPHEYRFDHFNVENARFPYPDASFDLVLFCEILEHLPNDPTHTLVEIHRVLRPGGKVILTTPNPARLENLVKCQRGENPYEALSGYGVYGRHNREYTVAELEDLLTGCGFEVDEIFTRDVWLQPEPVVLADDVNLEHRGENVFALATAGERLRWYYPTWLYQSLHAYQRAVRPELVVGVNCDLQTSGLHKLDDFGDRPGRWTIGKAEATLILAPVQSGWSRLRIEGRTADIGGMLRIFAETNGERFSWSVPSDGSPFSLEHGFHAVAGEQTVTIWGDRAWIPCEDGQSLDARVLGFAVHAASIELLPGGPPRPDVVVGVNCASQLAGVHHIEDAQGTAFRWTDGDSETVARLFPATTGEAALHLQGWTPDIGGEVTIHAALRDQSFSWTMPADGQPFTVTTAVEVAGPEEDVRISIDRPWKPSELKSVPDDRVLGFMIRSIGLRRPVPRVQALGKASGDQALRLTRKLLSRATAVAIRVRALSR